MNDFFQHSTIIKQVLTKEDFSVLARIVNTTPIDNNATTENKVKNGHQWIQNLEEAEQESRETFSRVSEDSIIFLSTPLLISTTDKIIRKTFLDDKNNLFIPVFYAGVVGMKKGIKKYDDSKDSGKSIHYIVRWFDVYAGRELARSEADALGVPYTRYKTLKKISAVRIKLNDLLGREPSNSEILDYFHTGRAELPNKGKRVSQTNDKKVKVSKSNSAITLTDVIEQERIYEAYFLSNSIINDIH